MVTKRTAGQIQGDAVSALAEANADLKQRLESLQREVAANLRRLEQGRGADAAGMIALAVVAEQAATRVKERSRALDLVVELRESTGQ